MEKLKIIKIIDGKYLLQNIESNQTYLFSLKFFDMEDIVGVGSIICMHKELLDPNYEEYSTEYYFGPIDQPYGRKITSQTTRDLIDVELGPKTIKLKRFFG